MNSSDWLVEHVHTNCPLIAVVPYTFHVQIAKKKEKRELCALNSSFCPSPGQRIPHPFDSGLSSLVKPVFCLSPESHGFRNTGAHAALQSSQSEALTNMRLWHTAHKSHSIIVEKKISPLAHVPCILPLAQKLQLSGTWLNYAYLMILIY